MIGKFVTLTDDSYGFNVKTNEPSILAEQKLGVTIASEPYFRTIGDAKKQFITVIRRNDVFVVLNRWVSREDEPVTTYVAFAISEPAKKRLEDIGIWTDFVRDYPVKDKSYRVFVKASEAIASFAKRTNGKRKYATMYGTISLLELWNTLIEEGK